MKTASIPVIDLNNPEDYEKLIDGLSKYGLCLIKDTNCTEIANDIINLGRKFFSLPLDKKKEYSVSRPNFNSGYWCIEDLTQVFTDGHIENTLEAISYGSKDYLKDPDLDICDIYSFPKEIENNFDKKVKEFAKRVLKVKSELLPLISSFLNTQNIRDLSSYKSGIDNYLSSPLWAMRVNHYPDNSSFMRTHTDRVDCIFNFTTQPGLEVKMQDDWESVPVVPGTFIFGVGEGLEALSDGKFKAYIHRVAKTNSDRYSLGLALMSGKSEEIYVKSKDAWINMYENLIVRGHKYLKYVNEELKDYKAIEDFHKRHAIKARNI
ncbi:2OG-Fe(II) oxygenase family protein [Francisella sp. 19X1-34]|uniref:2OG-Fe(II) oxygenase family protein n=1 Tax=Francisella sp. 19X1-34 TaxID=3087177 RepID=UPI002E2F8CB5|nr:2OG-Fe(II) oxygenase family protein [Francisella sp. 19X1-34]MED7788840.1 2OG-Fe(II) oxygenase family protein [Francisella sp. 19X1-34]